MYPKPGALILDDELIAQKEPAQEWVPFISPKDLKLLEKPKEFQSLIKKRVSRAK